MAGQQRIYDSMLVIEEDWCERSDFVDGNGSNEDDSQDSEEAKHENSKHIFVGDEHYRVK